MTMRNIFTLFVIGAMLQCSLNAAPILLNSPELWTLADAGWVVTEVPPNDSIASLQSGSTSNAARVQFAGGGSTPVASIAATNGNFIGNLQTNNLSVMFTFNSIEMAPASQQGALAVYFKAGANVWYYDSLYPPITTGLASYSVAMGTQGLWNQIAGAPAADYWTDLGVVTEFGFEIRGANAYVTQNYEILDVQFSNVVPEPETVWMMLMVLASLGITFRGRLLELGKLALASVRK